MLLGRTEWQHDGGFGGDGAKLLARHFGKEQTIRFHEPKRKRTKTIAS